MTDGASPLTPAERAMNEVATVLAEWSKPCTDNCEHAHCPLLRRLWSTHVRYRLLVAEDVGSFRFHADCRTPFRSPVTAEEIEMVAEYWRHY